VTIRITKYPITVDYKKIECIAKDYCVNLCYEGNSDFIVKTMSRMPFDMSGSQNIKTSFKLCFISNDCVVLRNGKLYTCSTIPSVHIFNEYFNKDLNVSAMDSIDIYKAKNIGEILDFLHKPVPFCRYCNWKAVQTQIPWRTSKREISEWT
jgi:hypothetical protein